MGKLLWICSFLFVVAVIDYGGSSENEFKVRNPRTVDHFTRLFRPMQTNTQRQFSGRTPSQHQFSVATSNQVPRYSQYSAFNAQAPQQSTSHVRDERKNSQSFGLMTTMIRRFMKSMAQFLGIQNSVGVSDARSISRQSEGKCRICLSGTLMQLT
jgi:hypothetical protein